jgi:zinc protease
MKNLARFSFSLGHEPAYDASGQALSHGPQVSAFTLKNGLQGIVIPDTRVPVVTHMLWYRNGSADDPIRQSGIAHFLEHLMFKGTDAHPAGEFSKVVAALGGQENAFTSYDYTAYFQRVAKEHLGRMMAFEADRMNGLLLEDSVVAPERDVVLEERRMRVETDPSAQLSEAMHAALFVHHPYGIPIIGWMHEIELLGREEALNYYQRFYTPENAILVVAGDITLQDVERLAEETYGRIDRGSNQASERPRRQRASEPSPRAVRKVTVADEKVEQPMLQRLYLVPSVLTASGLQSHALEVLAELLGGGQTSFLYRKMVLGDAAKAVHAGAWYMGSALDETRFALYAVPNEETELEDLETNLDAVLASCREEAFTPDALERAKTRLIADTVYSSDSQSALARLYGAALSIGENLEDIRLWPKKIESITRDDLVAVLEQFFIPRRSVTGYLKRGCS